MSWLPPTVVPLDMHTHFPTFRTSWQRLRCVLRCRHRFVRVSRRFECLCGVVVFIVGGDGWDVEIVGDRFVARRRGP